MADKRKRRYFIAGALVLCGFFIASLTVVARYYLDVNSGAYVVTYSIGFLSPDYPIGTWHTKAKYELLATVLASTGLIDDEEAFVCLAVNTTRCVLFTTYGSTAGGRLASNAVARMGHAYYDDGYATKEEKAEAMQRIRNDLLQSGDVNLFTLEQGKMVLRKDGMVPVAVFP